MSSAFFRSASRLRVIAVSSASELVELLPQRGGRRRLDQPRRLGVVELLHLRRRRPARRLERRLLLGAELLRRRDPRALLRRQRQRRGELGGLVGGRVAAVEL